ncbi:MAG TPA: MBL fold metallo-hydrolase [Candidatus Krumholzibacteria bacterium]|nr:MBL fold metallo-hydrolase [Candidatus Krumholzibacteria bacterium]
MMRCEMVLIAVCVLACAGCGGLSAPNAELFPAPPRDAVTFWGHACVYIDAGGVGVVTDPVFERSVIFRQRRIPSPPVSSYAGARVVLISHAHPDHLSAETLRTFPESVVILAPRPCAKYLDDVGREVRAVAPGDVFETDGVRVTAVAAHHMGPRLGLDAASDGRALGYVIETAAATIFYSGDTDYFSGFGDVGWTFDPDIAILNINGHLPSTDATRAAWATRAPVVIPAHWGGFGYWVFGGNKRPRDGETLARVIGDRLRVLEVGQSLPLPTPTFGASE